MPGSITKRAKGSWTVVVDLGPDPTTGKRRQLSRSVKGPKRLAEAKLVELLSDRNAGVERPTHRLTVSEYLDQWLRDYVATNTAPKTAQTYREIVKRHLSPAFGHLLLTGLRPATIQAFYGRAMQTGRVDGKGGLSARSVLRYHQILHAALHQAVRWQLLLVNPADAVEPPRPQRNEIRAFEPSELRKLLAAADADSAGPVGGVPRLRPAPHAAFFRTALLTGMRRGELLGLRWGDLDLEAGMLHVQQTAQRISGQGVVFRQPKTRTSRRAIALSPDAIRILRQHHRRQAAEKLLAGSAYEDKDLVFASGLGTAIEAGSIGRAWNRVRKAAGIDVRLHDLRHAHATLMLRQGTHPKVVSERLGHASVGITLDTYSHVLPGLQAAAAAQLDATLAAEEPLAESV